MARPRKFDEQAVLEGALRIFRERGFEGAKVPELSEELGICRQSFYRAFGDKRGLYLKALERHGEEEVNQKLALLEAAGSPLANLRRLLESLRAYGQACPSEGCFTVTALVENRDDADAFEVVATQVRRLEAGYIAVLERARAAGELHEDADPATLARTLIVLGHGMGVLTRLADSKPRVDAAVTSALALLDASARR